MKQVSPSIVLKDHTIPEKKYENGNLGHRPGIKEVIFLFHLLIVHKTRSEYLKALKDMGVKVEKHHHEVAHLYELGMYLELQQIWQIMFSYINMLS